MLHPDKVDHAPEISNRLLIQSGFVASTNGVQVHYWRVPAQRDKTKIFEHSKGLMILVHGNGSNLTDHIRHFEWLAEARYDLLIFDYRGHGQSTGVPDLKGSYEDLLAVLDYATGFLRAQNQPVYFYGQSLGGTLLLKAVSQNPERWNVDGVIAEDPFYSFKDVALERLTPFGVPSPIGILSYITFSNRYGLNKKELSAISPTPVYLFCSSDDPIISRHHCRALSENLRQPKLVVNYAEKGHLTAMADPASRSILLEALESAIRRRAP
jgi:alpha-beta hydrolase superfamily lysophospholipase